MTFDRLPRASEYLDVEDRLPYKVSEGKGWWRSLRARPFAFSTVIINSLNRRAKEIGTFN